mmetsp:Transcript_47701/g.34951  ORF Transcript_47701/g.34951 Transcript_47701/m.34951 type:complete len:91 (-) Transcript_47701:85-357(-)
MEVKKDDEPVAPVNKNLKKKESGVENEGEKSEGCCAKMGKVFSWLKFIFGGVSQHYVDGWNWIDTLFLTISLIAIIFWGLIVGEHFFTMD